MICGGLVALAPISVGDSRVADVSPVQLLEGQGI